MMRSTADIVRSPIPEEKRLLLEARWSELPDELKVGWQSVGQQIVHCGFTLGPSYCSFGCSHCYLPSNANRVPLPSLEDMKAQIDANRALMGPGSGLQITGGDVVDAYVRAGRPEELVEVVRYATDAGVVPMVMTHGQKLLEHPDLLDRLVAEAGLRKLAIHIDVTQAGRPGFPVRGLRSEADLHPLRERFVDLILASQERTGVQFAAAHTVTVTERNLDDVGELVDWMLGDPRRLRAFRMLSLQPEAAVGRTRSSGRPATPEAVWARVGEAVARRAPAGATTPWGTGTFWLGHPDCSHMTTLAVLYPSGRTLNLLPGGEEDREFFSEVLGAFGGVGFRGASPWVANLERLALVARRPSMVWKTLRFARHVLRSSGIGWLDALRHLLGRRFNALNIIQHNFMDASEIRGRSETVEKRLAACAFRGAVRDGDGWRAVPMCAMNAEERETLYAERIGAGPSSRGGRTAAARSSTRSQGTTSTSVRR
ncbi:MAG: hypothetical protein AAGN66_03780 [Acidobacteriota bacterium]